MAPIRFANGRAIFAKIVAGFDEWASELTAWGRGILPKRFPAVSLSAALFVGLFVVGMLRSYPQLTPAPESINAHDEATAIHSGYDLLQGTIPALAYHPLATAVFAVAYLLLHSSPFWFIEAEWLVRAFLYLGLWASLWIVARAFEPWIPAWTFAGLWVLAPLPDRLLANTSQMLFAILAALCLQQLIRFSSRGGIRHLLWASTFLGLAMLARSEALWVLVFSACAIVLVVYLDSKRPGRSLDSRPASRYVIPLVAYVLPFVAIVLIFLGLSYVRTGRIETGLGAHTFDALEAGQGVSFPERYTGDLHLSGIPDSWLIYGTREQNGYSLVRAVLRNPRAMTERIARNLVAMPLEFIKGYGGILGLWLVGFAICGAVALMRKKEWKLLAILVGFSLFEILYLPFFWLPDFWLFLFPITFALVSMGVKEIIEARAKWFWFAASALAAGALIVALVEGSWRFLYLGLATVAFLLASACAARTSARKVVQGLGVAALLFLFSSPTYAQAPSIFPGLSTDPAAQAAAWLQIHAAPDAKVAAWGATMVYLSNRPFLSLEGYLTTPTQMEGWLLQNHIDYLYADTGLANTFPNDMPAVNALAVKGCLDLQFQDAQGVGKLYMVQSQCAP